MTHRPRRWSKAMIFAVLLTLLLVLSLLPTRWTGPLHALGQPLQWIVSPVAATTRSLQRSGERWSEGRLNPTVNELASENEALRRQVGHFALQIEQLRADVDALAGVRDALNDANARILVARVIAPVSDPQREAIRVARGSLQGAAVGQWVAAGSPVNDDEMSGRELLARQWLIGRVIEVHPQESIVQLASDRDFRVAVQLGSARDDFGGWALLPEELPLIGRGDGGLLIRQAEKDYRTIGARVAVVPRSSALPSPMAIGRIVESQRLDATQLHFDLLLRPWRDPRMLAYVYIISF